MTKMRTRAGAKPAPVGYSKGLHEGVNRVAEAPSRYQLRLPFKERLGRSEPARKLDVEGTLRRLLKQDLTFKGEKTNSATHNLHAFAAKFPPQLPRLFVNELTNPGREFWIQWPVRELRWSKPCSQAGMP